MKFPTQQKAIPCIYTYAVFNFLSGIPTGGIWRYVYVCVCVCVYVYIYIYVCVWGAGGIGAHTKRTGGFRTRTSTFRGRRIVAASIPVHIITLCIYKINFKNRPSMYRPTSSKRRLPFRFSTYIV